MNDHVLIYAIVFLNILCQLMLIWRQNLAVGSKWKFCCLAIAIPVVIMVAMRLMIFSGIIHGRIADQSLVERYITQGTSILLIAGPWLVMLSAVYVTLKNRAVQKKLAAH